jgi:mannose-6-phosphate isomerase
MPLYPLKFRPRFVEKIWGGRKLQTVLGKMLPPEKPIGESWELYDFPPGVVEKSKDWVSSRIANGRYAGQTLHWAVNQFKSDLLGNVPPTGREAQFPILIKFLDAREDLSVQVHPDQAYADAHPEAHLKSEAWYVLQNDPGSRLLLGLTPGTTRAGLERAVLAGNVEEVICSVPAREADCVYLPSGTVHALGAGLLVAEVQTPSDTTFRLFDFNRIDPATKAPRQLHVEQALACIDFSAGPLMPAVQPAGSRLVGCPYFNIDRLDVHSGQSHTIHNEAPTVLIILHGSAEVTDRRGTESIQMSRGEVVLLPAALGGGVINAASACTLLVVTFP